jgi:N-acetylglutamate synthase-like GNAT family acetyltransferase
MDFEIFENKEPQDITSLINQLFDEHNTENTGHVSRKFSMKLTEGEKTVCVARCKKNNKDISINDLAVTKEMRKQGYGTKALQHIENYALENKCETLTTSTFEYQAPEFYKKNGFEELGKIEKYRGEHSLIFLRKKSKQTS